MEKLTTFLPVCRASARVSKQEALNIRGIITVRLTSRFPGLKLPLKLVFSEVSEGPF